MLETYLVIFLLAEEAYAIPVSHVQEIQAYASHKAPRQVPDTAAHFEGIIDLREEFIPVLDLKQHFQLGKTIPSRKTCYIIVQTETEKVAVLVDAVLEVQKVQEEELTSPPDRMKQSVRNSYISGITRLQSKQSNQTDTIQVLHIDIQKLLNADSD